MMLIHLEPDMSCLGIATGGFAMSGLPCFIGTRAVSIITCSYILICYIIW